MLVEFKDAHLSRQLNGVLDAFPTLEVCLPHAGGVLPILNGRWDQGDRVRSECRTRHDRKRIRCGLPE